MKVILYSTRRVSVETFPKRFVGTQYEQNATTLEFDFSDLKDYENVEDMTKTIHFFDNNLSEDNYIENLKIENNKCSLNSNITKCENVIAFIQIEQKNNFVWKSESFILKFRPSLNIEPKLECEHTTEKTFEKKSKKEYCGDEVMICSKCEKEISRTPVHEHDYLVTENAASTNYECKNCDYEYEKVKNPFG